MADRYELSAGEIQELTDWPGAMVDAYLNLIEEVKELQADADSVRGIVSGAGVIVAGASFTAARTSAGVYTVTFGVEKTSSNYIALPVASTDGCNAVYASKTTTGFTVRITDSAGALTDSEFNFMVKES